MKQQKKRQWILCGILLVIGIMGFCIGARKNRSEKEVNAKTEAVITAPSVIVSQEPETVTEQPEPERKEDTEEEGNPLLIVYICGEVKHPGVYEMPKESRLNELVEEAGGLTEDAVPESVNLAVILEDGKQYTIPSELLLVKEQEEAELKGLVDLNHATLEDLMTLPGIGEVKAKAILDYREKNGEFHSPEDLLFVEGIKEGTLSQIKDLLSITN